MYVPFTVNRTIQYKHEEKWGGGETGCGSLQLRGLSSKIYTNTVELNLGHYIIIFYCDPDNDFWATELKAIIQTHTCPSFHFVVNGRETFCTKERLNILTSSPRSDELNVVSREHSLSFAADSVPPILVRCIRYFDEISTIELKFVIFLCNEIE